jgi:MscS family membrane protein
MNTYFPEVIELDIQRLIQIGLMGIATIIAVLGISQLPKLIISFIGKFISPNFREAFEKIVNPYQRLIAVVISLAIAQITFLILTPYGKLTLLEIALSLTLTITATWLTSRIFKELFDVYLIEIALKQGRQVNSELLITGKFITNFTIIVIAIIIFAQTHQINVFGIIASLGVGGLAVAFAAQNTLSQLLGGIVLYIDRPFIVDDYIGLPDGTFGRVESIGLRSTKIRTSGKGTLTIVPNNSLTQMNIENFSGAKKVMSILYLTFSRAIAPEEQALIREVILESTIDIFGIDTRSTDIKFRNLNNTNGEETTQVQITFFILSSGKISMDLRRQLLDNARQNMTIKLKDYGISFEIEEPNIYVDSPITI